ncbi:MAG: RrF2 family transcriptional regulator [Desulfobulbaceae bacterium]
MFTIGSKCRYGILAVLTLAEHHGGGLLQIKDIAASRDIPSQYLGQICNLLVKADIIRSVRGKRGGYELARDPSRITVLELVEVLDGEIQLTSRDAQLDDVLRELFASAEQKLRDTFQVSLADLLRSRESKNRILTYEI